MAAKNIHEWKSTTADGEKRDVRASKFGKQWRIQFKLKDDENWTYCDSLEVDDLIQLRDVLWRKYQRKRVSHDDIVDVDRLIRERGGKPEPID